MDSDPREQAFLEQSDLFVTRALSLFGLSSLAELPDVRANARPLDPIFIEDYRNLSPTEKNGIVSQYRSRFGVAYFIVLNPASAPPHPLHVLAGQLSEQLNLAHPLEHPLEKHPTTVERFGADGTLKVYDTAKSGEVGYREQGETSEEFLVHHDGLGSGGTVQTVALYMESPPLAGGYTYFQNVCLRSLELASTDREAFRHLFLPDAITVIRPRGKGAIRVTCPVLFLNEGEMPQSVFRAESGEYSVIWRDLPALSRAKAFLTSLATPFAPGSSFVHLCAKGHGCLINNEFVAHGRTAFVDAPVGTSRVLARKWYMRYERDREYKHVPGLLLAHRFASMYPEYFGPDVTQGEWNLDATTGVNVRRC